jgi:hypothetical protein
MRPVISGRSITEFSERNVPTAETPRGNKMDSTLATSTLIAAGAPAGAGAADFAAGAALLPPATQRAPTTPNTAPSTKTAAKPAAFTFMESIIYMVLFKPAHGATPPVETNCFCKWQIVAHTNDPRQTFG